MRKLFWLLFIPAWGCTNTQPAKPAFKTEILDTIGIYISPDYKWWLSRQKQIKHEQAIGPIYSIENGVDSFELRLRIHYSLSSGSDLYIIKIIDTSWVAEHLISYSKHSYNNNWDSILIGRTLPKCGWKPFMDSLNYLGLYNLPSQRQIKGFSDGINDGITYTVEIATKNSYKRFKYHSPDLFQDSTNKRFWNILLFWNRNIELSYMDRR